MKPSILIVSDANLAYHYEALECLAAELNIVFLHEKSIPIRNQGFIKLGKLVYWQNFSDAFEIIDCVNPALILWYHIDTFVEVALLLAAKERGIKNVHFEHGLHQVELLNNLYRSNTHLNHHSSFIHRVLKLRFHSLYRYIWQHFFIRKTKKRLNKHAGFLVYYISTRRKFSSLDAARNMCDERRCAEHYITFGKELFLQRKLRDNIHDTVQVHVIGNPGFDAFISKWTFVDNPGPKTLQLFYQVVLIDQPIGSQFYFGWDVLSRSKAINELSSVVVGKGFQFYFKPHPRESTDVYAQLDPSTIVHSEVELARLLERPTIVLGYWSTLLMPLTGLHNTCLLTLEFHPHEVDFLTSQFLVDEGVACACRSMDELAAILQAPDRLYKVYLDQFKHKEEFVNRWLYVLDGNAGERFIELIRAWTTLSHAHATP